MCEARKYFRNSPGRRTSRQWRGSASSCLAWGVANVVIVCWVALAYNLGIKKCSVFLSHFANVDLMEAHESC